MTSFAADPRNGARTANRTKLDLAPQSHSRGYPAGCGTPRGTLFYNRTKLVNFNFAQLTRRARKSLRVRRRGRCFGADKKARLDMIALGDDHDKEELLARAHIPDGLGMNSGHLYDVLPKSIMHVTRCLLRNSKDLVLNATASLRERGAADAIREP
ncbi:hypothetical protein MRX96_058264 [Rhipicephalus microplus]